MKEEQLLFLISLPRSGSTLLQRILGANKNIYTRSEPWIMLHPAYQFKTKGINTEYESLLAQKGVTSFIEGMGEDGKDIYNEKLKECYLSLYDKYLLNTEKTIFLDKTPRYYLIIDELLEIFPNSKIVLLYRNPLAVMFSILQTWVKDDLRKLSQYEIDLFEAPSQLAKHKNNQRLVTIRYEDLVLDPETHIKSICDYIGVGYTEEMINYSNNNDEAWLLGDQINAFAEKKVTTRFANKWEIEIQDPQIWRIMFDYFNYLGKDAINNLGYNYEEIHQIFIESNNYNIQDKIKKRTMSLHSLMAIGNVANKISADIVTNVTREVKSLKAMNQKYIEINKQYENSIKVKEKEKQELKISIEKLTKQNASLKTELDNQKTQYDHLNETLRKKSEEYENLKNTKAVKLNEYLHKMKMLLK